MICRLRASVASVTVTDSRRPRSVYGVGVEPDPRTSLANERTALAALRTALGIVIAGVALGALAHLTEHPGWFRVIAVVLCLLGGAFSLAAVQRWAVLERALRLGDPLPAPRTLSPLAVAVAALSLAVAIALVLSALD